MSTRIILSSVAVAVMTVTAAAPSFAYRIGEPPFPPAHMRRLTDMRDSHVTFQPVVALADLLRDEAMQDQSGRMHLARARLSVRTHMRNTNRHLLGASRGNDYRILDTRDTFVRSGSMPVATGLPPRLVGTGGQDTDENFGKWNWDRPSRRDIRGDRDLR